MLRHREHFLHAGDHQLLRLGRRPALGAVLWGLLWLALASACQAKSVTSTGPGKENRDHPLAKVAARNVADLAYVFYAPLDLPGDLPAAKASELLIRFSEGHGWLWPQVKGQGENCVHRDQARPTAFPPPYWNDTEGESLEYWLCLLEGLAQPTAPPGQQLESASSKRSVRMLDVGAGYGLLAPTTAWLLERFSVFGFNASLDAVAVEPSHLIERWPSPLPDAVQASAQRMRSIFSGFSLAQAPPSERHRIRTAQMDIRRYIERWQAGQAVATDAQAIAAFDLIVAVESMTYVPDKLGTFAHLHNMLRPGGLLLLINVNYPWYAFTAEEPACGVDAARSGTSELEGGNNALESERLALPGRSWFAYRRTTIHAVIRQGNRRLVSNWDYLGEGVPDLPPPNPNSQAALEIWSQVSTSRYRAPTPQTPRFSLVEAADPGT